MTVTSPSTTTSNGGNKRDHDTMTAENGHSASVTNGNAAFVAKPMTKVLIYGGKTGWIGAMMHDMCKEQGTLWLS